MEKVLGLNRYAGLSEGGIQNEETDSIHLPRHTRHIGYWFIHERVVAGIGLLHTRINSRLFFETKAEQVIPSTRVGVPTLATVLLNQGAPSVAAQSILGHEKTETTQLYATLSGASRQQACQRYFVQ